MTFGQKLIMNPTRKWKGKYGDQATGGTKAETFLLGMMFPSWGESLEIEASLNERIDDYKSKSVTKG